jgi:hypothetical protein
MAISRTSNQLATADGSGTNQLSDELPPFQKISFPDRRGFVAIATGLCLPLFLGTAGCAVAWAWPLGGTPLTAEFLLGTGSATLAILALEVSVLVVATQLGAESGKFDLLQIVSPQIHLYFLLLLATAIFALALSHHASVTAKAQVPRPICVQLPARLVRALPSIPASVTVERVVADRAVLCSLVTAFLLLGPVAAHIYGRVRPAKVFSLLGRSVARSIRRRTLKVRASRLRGHLLAVADPGDATVLEQGLTALEACTQRLIFRWHGHHRTAAVQEMCHSLQRLTEASGQSDFLLERILGSTLVLARILSRHPDGTWASRALRPIRQLLEQELLRWCDGELPNAAGLRTMRVLRDLARLCAARGLSVSFAKSAECLRRCVEQMLANRNARGLTAAFAGLVTLGQLAVDAPQLNLRSICREFVESLGLIVETDSRPLLVGYRLRGMSKLALELLSPTKTDLVGMSYDFARQLAQLEAKEFGSVLEGLLALLRSADPA